MLNTMIALHRGWQFIKLKSYSLNNVPTKTYWHFNGVDPENKQQVYVTAEELHVLTKNEEGINSILLLNPPNYIDDRVGKFLLYNLEQSLKSKISIDIIDLEIDRFDSRILGRWRFSLNGIDRDATIIDNNTIKSLCGEDAVYFKRSSVRAPIKLPVAIAAFYARQFNLNSLYKEEAKLALQNVRSNYEF